MSMIRKSSEDLSNLDIERTTAKLAKFANIKLRKVFGSYFKPLQWVQNSLYETRFEVPLKIFAEKPKLFHYVLGMKSKESQQEVYYNNLEEVKIPIALELSISVHGDRMYGVFYSIDLGEVNETIGSKRQLWLNAKSSRDVIKTSDIKDAVGFIVDKIMRITNAPKANFEDDYISLSKKAHLKKISNKWK